MNKAHAQDGVCVSAEFARARCSASRGLGWFFAWGCIGLLVFGPIGCGRSGPTTVRVTGRVLLKGQPLSVTPTEAQLGALQLRFIELDPNGVPTGRSYSANAKPDGSFNVLGIGGRGLPPGRYRIAVYQYDPYPEDKLGGRFSEERSPIVRQIEASGDLGVIELSEAQ